MKKQEFAMPPINPEWEALSWALRHLHEAEIGLRRRYKAYPEQITAIEAKYKEIIKELEIQIVKADQ